MGMFSELGLCCYLEPRLVKRYEILVKENMTVNPANAPGVKALANHQQAWSSTQATWLFLNNENVTFPMLSGPLLSLGRAGISQSSGKYALVAHDWSRINYSGHHSKADKTQMTHERDVGYELQASLLIDSHNGHPVAPLGMNLRAEDGLYQCREMEVQPKQPHLTQLIETIDWQENLRLSKPLVHIVDREADSASHLRQLSKGSLWLTRSKKGSTLFHDGEFKTLDEIAKQLTPEPVDTVTIRGKEGLLFVAETEVTLQRKSEKTLDEAPRARMVLSLVTDIHGKELARWYLLTNVWDVSATEIATWYCWRWNIESWFKLLKSDGFQMEKWQQTTGDAIFRRLIVSSMACTLALRLYNDESEESQALKLFLVKLSGRVTKRSKPVTLPALLAGLWLFIQMSEMMASYSAEEILGFQQLASSYFGQLV